MTRLLIVLCSTVIVSLAQGFTLAPIDGRSVRLLSRNKPCALHAALRKNVRVPLLDVVGDEEYKDKILTPLPSNHLPTELSTPYIYGMQLDRGVHKLLMQEAVESATIDAERVYGHIVWKVPHSDSLVGAIGCTSEIIVHAPATQVYTDVSLTPPLATTDDEDDDDNDETPSSSSSASGEPVSTVLCRGAYRFVVREVIKTIPYPVAIIDEITDDNDDEDSGMFAALSGGNDQDDEADDEDDDDDDCIYADLKTSELIQRTMRGIQAVVSQKLQAANDKVMSPLEKSILEMEDTAVNANNMDAAAVERSQAEEMMAVWDVFQSSLVDDIAPDGRQFAIAIMGAALADFSNDLRQELLVCRNRQERLRMVLKHLDEVVGMARARKMASQITEGIDNDDRDLKVGAPQLPPWAKSIVKGTKVEYFWSEKDGWFPGVVIEVPVMVLDELLITVRFSDGEVQKLPFTGDEKVRWRPGQ
jgi:hypothetical protein